MVKNSTPLFREGVPQRLITLLPLVSPFSDPLILHTKRNIIYRGKGNELLRPLASQEGVGTQSIRTRERLGGLLKYYSREAA
jgi:hypothetical protein